MQWNPYISSGTIRGHIIGGMECSASDFVPRPKKQNLNIKTGPGENSGQISSRVYLFKNIQALNNARIKTTL